MALKKKGNGKLPPFDESVAAHLCPPTHPSPVERLQHSLDVPTHQLDKQTRRFTHGGPPGLPGQTPPVLGRGWPRPHSQTTAQAISRSMASLVVLERHLWLTLTEIRDADKVPFLDSPVYLTGLFGPAVEEFAERFTVVHKSSQAMQHFLLKRSALQLARVTPDLHLPRQLTDYPGRTQACASRQILFG